MREAASQNSKNRGPKPERVKIDMDWEDAVGKAIKKKRPAGGWPEEDKKKKKSQK